MIDKNKLAAIHIVKDDLGLTDQQYRDILQSVAGVTTAKDLDDQKFRKLMHYLVHSRHYRLNEDGFTIRQKLFIQGLSREIGWDRRHLNNFLHKYYHKTDIIQLTKKEAIKVIESLKKVKEHQLEKGREWENKRY